MIEIGAKDFMVIGASAAALLALVFTALSYQRLSRLKLGLLSLRITALALILAVLGEIRWRAGAAGIGGELHVVIDTSQSMHDDRIALEQALDSLEAWAQDRRVRLHFWRLDSGLQSASSRAEAIKADFNKDRTAITQGLRELENHAGPEAIALLLSDGVETEEWNPPSTKMTVHALAFGTELSNDAALEDARFPPVIFSRGDTPFRITLRYPRDLKESTAVLVRDKKSSEILWQGRITPSGVSPEEFALNLTAPRGVGRRTLEIEVRPYAWETVTANNILTVETEILREKLRILYLAGKPTLDYAYLREYLRSQHERELVSFVILRNPEDAPPFGESELSLIPFPAHDIFTATLSEFDLFILQDFSLSRFGLPNFYMDNIRGFVENGGGFIFISGENTARSQEFSLQPLQTTGQGLLPTLFGITQTGSGGLVESASASLEIMDTEFWNRLFPYAGDAAKNMQLWRSRTASAHSYELVSGHKNLPGARLLASISDNGQKHPALITRELGKGRAVWMGFIGNWLWKSEATLVSGASDLYDFFWKNLTSWVTQSDPETESMKALLETGEGGLRLTVRLPPKFRRDAAATLQAELLPQRKSLILREKYPASGLYEGYVENEERRALKRISVWTGGKRMEVEITPREPVRHEMRMSADLAYLNALTEKNRGKLLESVSPAALDAVWTDRTGSSNDRENGDRFIAGPWPIVLAAILLLAEWFLRRWYRVTP